jgi:hypothetical protein
MDEDIIALVNDYFFRASRNSGGNRNIFSFIDRNKLVELVLSNKDRFNPDRKKKRYNYKGDFDSFFSAITKSYMVRLYKRDEKRIKLIMNRQSKIRKVLT